MAVAGLKTSAVQTKISLGEVLAPGDAIIASKSSPPELLGRTIAGVPSANTSYRMKSEFFALRHACHKARLLEHRGSTTSLSDRNSPRSPAASFESRKRVRNVSWSPATRYAKSSILFREEFLQTTVSFGSLSAMAPLLDVRAAAGRAAEAVPGGGLAA